MIMNTIDLPDADEIIDDNPDEEENNDVTINKELEKYLAGFATRWK